MDAVEIVMELVMQILIGLLLFLFWSGYRQTKSRDLLVITVVFAFIFLAHVVFPVYLEDIRGIRFEDPFEPHHLILLLTFAVMTYILIKQRMQGVRFGRSTLRREDKSKKDAA